MRKGFLLVILSGVILAGVVMVLAGRHSPFGKKNTSFASEPQKEITRIVMSDGDRELVLLNANGRWMINGKTETRKSSVSHILRILKEMTIKSPVSPGLFDSVVVRKNIEPVRVKAYENRRLLSNFLVYKTTSNIYGNIMKKSERAKPFIVSVPGQDTDIGSAFTMNELYWQPYTIFNLLPSEIVSVRFENLADTSSSFSIFKSGKTFEFIPPGTNTITWDSVLIRRYLTYFTFIPFESWALNLHEEEKEKILAESASYRIDVKTADREIVLSLWERKNPDGTTDSDRLYGKLAGTDQLFIVRYFDIDPVLKKREYFIRKE
ncbi:MAG TPA: hypothetical protein VK207_11565 [Bacteroidales bacterium]|nr:hypothetical protein [Bacteroidales bacterium]